MKRETAKKLMEIYLKAGMDLNAIEAHLADLQDEKEVKSIIDSSCHIIMELYEQCMKPIIAQFPDLDPDKAAK